MVDPSEVQADFASSRIDMAKFALVMLFMVEQRWRYFIDKDLEPDNITTTQWLMLIVIAAGFRSPPSIQEVADAMSTTHQNVKQVAASMERRGLMALERDPDNRRIIRLKITDRCAALFQRREEEDKKTIARMFENLTDDEMKALFGIIAKVERQADLLYHEAKARKATK
ncbi:MAG: transcriptional regulator SlyA [Methanocella sp. PtaU1.Bin125]|nr:MAG: transcriptional regulator SlyA [Methanocella sp. PtaU1.Bin125]